MDDEQVDDKELDAQRRGVKSANAVLDKAIQLKKNDHLELPEKNLDHYAPGIEIKEEEEEYQPEDSPLRTSNK